MPLPLGGHRTRSVASGRRERGFVSGPQVWPSCQKANSYQIDPHIWGDASMPSFVIPSTLLRQTHFCPANVHLPDVGVDGMAPDNKYPPEKKEYFISGPCPSTPFMIAIDSKKSYDETIPVTHISIWRPS